MKGATLIGTISLLNVPGFNPRTREGCDKPSITGNDRFIGFNPRTREGCDRHPDDGRALVRVSIHAPVKGATNVGTIVQPSRRGFNPRTREGCDTLRWSDFEQAEEFQSTHP